MDDMFDNVNDNTAIILMLGVLSAKLTEVLNVLCALEEKLGLDKSSSLYS